MRRRHAARGRRSARGAGELGNGDCRVALGGGPFPALGYLDERLNRVEGLQRVETVARAGEVPQGQGRVPGRTVGQSRSSEGAQKNFGRPKAEGRGGSRPAARASTERHEPEPLVCRLDVRLAAPREVGGSPLSSWQEDAQTR